MSFPGDVAPAKSASAPGPYRQSFCTTRTAASAATSIFSAFPRIRFREHSRESAGCSSSARSVASRAATNSSRCGRRCGRQLHPHFLREVRRPNTRLAPVISQAFIYFFAPGSRSDSQTAPGLAPQTQLSDAIRTARVPGTPRPSNILMILPAAFLPLHAHSACAGALLALPVRAKMSLAKVCTPNIAFLSGAIV